MRRIWSVRCSLGRRSKAGRALEAWAVAPGAADTRSGILDDEKHSNLGIRRPGAARRSAGPPPRQRCSSESHSGDRPADHERYEVRDPAVHHDRDEGRPIADMPVPKAPTTPGARRSPRRRRRAARWGETPPGYRPTIRDHVRRCSRSARRLRSSRRCSESDQVHVLFTRELSMHPQTRAENAMARVVRPVMRRS